MLVLRFVANLLYTCAMSWYNSTPVPVLPQAEFRSARSKGPAPVKLWAFPPSDPSGQSVLEMLHGALREGAESCWGSGNALSSTAGHCTWCLTGLRRSPLGLATLEAHFTYGPFNE